MADWEAVAAELWSFVEYWRSENYMAKVIAKFHPDEPNGRIFAAASNSSACVRQALAYESSAASADISVRPLLLYYAFLNWIKALLHVMDVTYPSEAAVLQHGISVRRTKRVSYQLPSEMVYIYKQGVLQSAADTVGMKLPQRILLGDVLGMLPPVHHLMSEFYPKFQHLYPVQEEVNANPIEAEENTVSFDGDCVLVPRTIAANNGQTVEEWISDLLQADRDAPENQSTSRHAFKLLQKRNNKPSEGKLALEANKPFEANRSCEGNKTSEVNRPSPINMPSEVNRLSDGGNSRTQALSQKAHDEVACFLHSARHAPVGYLRLPRSIVQHPWMMKVAESCPSVGITARASSHATDRKEQDTVANLLLSNRTPLTGWASHFIVLYCLSALVRYNPLEWSDILRWHNEPDALLVETYLRYAPLDMRLSLAALFRDMVTDKALQSNT